jgi:hypothetical protein
VDLAPLATVIGPMLFGLPLTSTRHLDAGAVDQEVQSLCGALFPLRERNLSGRLARPKWVRREIFDDPRESYHKKDRGKRGL